jgi:hypothetical protein
MNLIEIVMMGKNMDDNLKEHTNQEAGCRGNDSIRFI